MTRLGNMHNWRVAMSSAFLLAQLMHFSFERNSNVRSHARTYTYVRMPPPTWLITFEHILLRTYVRTYLHTNRTWDPQVIRTCVLSV